MSNTTVSANTPEFVDFLARAQARLDEYMATNFPTLTREILVADELEKFIRIWKRPETQRSELDRGTAWGFVARVDNSTKALGNVKAGDVLKPATWKAPAKTARGNIFQKDEQFGAPGVSYLK